MLFKDDIKEYINSKKNEFDNMMSYIKMIHDLSKNNGKLTGFLVQTLLPEFLNLEDKRSELVPEREGQPNNYELRDEVDFKYKDFKVSLKTTSSFIQYSTNLIVTDRLYSLKKERIKDRDEINFIFEPFLQDKNELLVFDLNISKIFIVDKFDLVNKINLIYKSDGKNGNFCFLTGGVTNAGTIKYGEGKANAFQRGIWHAKNKKMYSYTYFEELYDFSRRIDIEAEKRKFLDFLFLRKGE